jgi:hypothetical protein
LKSDRVVPYRGAISASLERRHAEVRAMWREMLRSVDISTFDENEAKA